jgi:hypothetical protein
MQRARRLASTAVVAVLAVSGLSACRAEPDVAAYIGRTTITQARVEGVYADAERKLAIAVEQVRAQQSAAPDPNAQPVPEKVELQIKRKDVLEALIGAGVLRDIAKARNVQPTEIPAAQVAQSVGLPEDAEYVKIYSEYRSYLAALSAVAKPIDVTEADMRQVYDRFRAGGGLGETPVPFEEFSTNLTAEDKQVLQKSIGLRNELKADVEKLDTTINPRYGVRELPLLPVSTQSGASVVLVGLPFGGGSDDGPAVTDLP